MPETYDDAIHALKEQVESLKETNELLSQKLAHTNHTLGEILEKVGKAESNSQTAKESIYKQGYDLSEMKLLLQNLVSKQAAPAPESMVTLTVPMSKAVSMFAPSSQMQTANGTLPASQLVGADAAKLMANPTDTTVLSDLEKDYCKKNQKINAIKEFRSRTGVGLKEAKDVVDAWMAVNCKAA